MIGGKAGQDRVSDALRHASSSWRHDIKEEKQEKKKRKKRKNRKKTTGARKATYHLYLNKPLLLELSCRKTREFSEF
jgi:hypothetical protein